MSDQNKENIIESLSGSSEDHRALLAESVEKLVVLARELGFAREQIIGGIERQWERP